MLSLESYIHKLYVTVNWINVNVPLYACAALKHNTKHGQKLTTPNRKKVLNKLHHPTKPNAYAKQT